MYTDSGRPDYPSRVGRCLGCQYWTSHMPLCGWCSVVWDNDGDTYERMDPAASILRERARVWLETFETEKHK